MNLVVHRNIPKTTFAGKHVKVGDTVASEDMTDQAFAYYVREGYLMPAPGETGHVPVAPRPRGRPRKPGKPAKR